MRILDPLLKELGQISLQDPKQAKVELDRRFAMDSSLLQEIRTAMTQGMEEGWLLPKEAGGVRFGRLAKDQHGFSVDAVWMDGAGPGHVHPNGEIDLCFAMSGEPKFDGNAPGWTVYAPGSEHVPTVSGGEMLILYCLPGGAIKFR